MPTPPARPAFPAALGLLVLGLGIALLDVRVAEVWFSEVFAVVAMQIALLGLIGHVFGVPELYGSLTFDSGAGMALHTAIGLLALGAGLLCARGERGVMEVLRSQTPGGTLARRWIITPTGVLCVMGLVYLTLQRTAGAGRSVATWALLMTALLVLTGAIWAIAHVLHRAGLERNKAQRTLENRVWQRTAELNKANSALKRAKEELAQANQGLEKTVQERTVHLNETIHSLETVCYNIAHDLRAPNRAIAGFAQALLKEYSSSLDAMARDCLVRIARAAQRSDALTLDLLAYGRLGHAELPCSSQCLRTHITAVLDKMAEEISASNAVVDVEGPLPALWANPTALEQVLTNLLSNGLKFVHEGVPARITIRTATTAGYCRVLIQDNGIGIAKEHQRSIFGVFQRLHSADKYPGSGIGLAIVQKSVERMEGKVGVSSTSGKGSCFWFELRLA